jgi:excisionase family DNA binding protein
MVERVLLSPEDVATMLSVSREFIYKQIFNGTLPHVRVGRKVIRINPDDVAKYLIKPHSGPVARSKKRGAKVVPPHVRRRQAAEALTVDASPVPAPETVETVEISDAS